MTDTQVIPQIQTGDLVHTEVITNDVEATKTFFNKTFGWTYDDVPMPGGQGTYAMWKIGDTVRGGITPPMMEGAQPSTLNYLNVDNVDNACNTIQQNGGTILQPGMDVGEHGRMAVFQEPGGAVMAVWQSFNPS